MKKLLITAALLAAVTSSFAQGTVYFSNGTLTRLSVGSATIPLTGQYTFGLFYGIGQSTSLTFLDSALGYNSTSSLGIIAGADRKSAITAVGIPGTIATQNDIWLQVKGWDSSFGIDWLLASKTEGAMFGESAIRDIGPLGPTTGPGVQIWQNATGTGLTQLNAFALNPVAVIPEPASMALAGLGLASLLIFRRRN